VGCRILDSFGGTDTDRQFFHIEGRVRLRVRLIDPFCIWEGSDKCESTAGLEELRTTLKDTG
tara:strand:+ start:268 stop:453 length:186 start_codon:yes stop_codon:yes gene_type:complete